MNKKPGSSTRDKRKRESESSSSTSEPEVDPTHPSFMQRAEAATGSLLEMLKECQLQLVSEKNTGGTISCCATYSFSKEIKQIKSQQMNGYGFGQLKVVHIGMDGTDIQPLPEWMESHIHLQAYFEKKVATDMPHSSGDSNKRGFEVPWRANIQLESIPIGCVVESVQLSFICPTGRGSPTITIHPDHGANLYYLNDKWRNITGQTYSECCQELGIFRQATVYIKMRIPFRLLMREQLGQLRKGIPVYHPNRDADSDFEGDNVTLKCGRFSVKVGRGLLCAISKKTATVFSKKGFGKMTVCEMNYGKEAVLTVVYAGGNNFAAFPLDPLEAQPLVLHEIMCLSWDWEVEPLKWVAQFALLERLCTLGFDAETVPWAMPLLWSNYKHATTPEHTGVAKFLVAGFVIVMQSMESDEIEGATDWTLPAGVTRNNWLWDMIKDIVEPVAVDREVEEDGASENAQSSAPSALGEYLAVRLVCLSGKKLHFRVKRSASVERLKAMIYMRLNIPSEGFRLRHYGPRGYRTLDSGTVADYGMEDGDKIYLIPIMRGC